MRRSMLSLWIVVSGFVVGPAVRAQAQQVDVSRVVAELEPEIQRQMIQGRIPSMTAALVVGDSIVWTGAYGYANLWSRALAAPNTVYLIGSTFKAQSTVALLQQMEQGKFKLDDPVNNYLTEFKIRNETPGKPVTFRHLLTHTSGLPGGFGGVPVWSDTAPPPLAEYLKRDLAVISPPLDSVRYSNLAYSLVGYLVQKFSGEDYKTYIRKNIWKPLEMTSTDFNPTPSMDERLAMPYGSDSAGRPIPAVRVKAAVWPAGIVYGTIIDQAHWLIMNLNGGVFHGHRFLTEETVRMMQTRQYDRFTGPEVDGGGWGNETTGYGLTWWTMLKDGQHYIGHSGSVQGYTAFVHGNVDKRFGIVLLSNGNRAHPYLVNIVNRATDLVLKYSK